MIYVRVELWPGGMRGHARTLGEVVIANVGGDAEHGDYDVRLSKFNGFGNPATPKDAETWKRGRVTGFPRLALGGFDLLLVALGSALAGRMRDLAAVGRSESSEPDVWSGEAPP